MYAEGSMIYTIDIEIAKLMEFVDTGKAQLPDFQRGWAWDDNRIKALIASVASNYPVGAAMFLDYGNNDIRFKYRPIEGASVGNTVPDELILDGQQRLTSLYASLYCTKPVKTNTDKRDCVYRYYYIDINKAIDKDTELLDCIISIPENRIITSNFGRAVLLDISSPEKEYKRKLFPLNIILDNTKVLLWQNEFYKFYDYDKDVIEQFEVFFSNIVLTIMQYKMPVIHLDKNTPKEAVCQVFENVNTGGVSLTVFELVTAMFAMDDYQLRDDWNRKRNVYFNSDILGVLTATDFLQACTLLSNYKKGGPVSCKKKDVLSLALNEYKKYADALTDGFKMAEKILQEERIFSARDLPYTTQLIPLAVLCTLLADDNQIKATSVKEKIKKWYWCGVFGELYDGANETRYVNDIIGVMEWVKDDYALPRTLQDAYFNPTRLLSLQTRQSAAYKGVMALIYKNHCKDFISGEDMDFTLYQNEKIDIHHIFPRKYCEKLNYPKDKWNSVLNKTPITESTNRELGGFAPIEYLTKIENKGKISSAALDAYISTHWIDAACLRSGDFDAHIIYRAKALLSAIENATGKIALGKDSKETIDAFGSSLV